MFPFEKILTYIANEQCALVVGPEIMQFEGQPMNMYLRNKLYKLYETELPHYYANEGLYQFPAQEISVKSDLAQSFKKECYNLPNTEGYNEDVLKTIAKLPFHLILSINPDTFLSDTFYKYGIKHRFSHFRKGDRPCEEVAAPTREEPLIYNISGSILEDESLVLDYEDLYSMIGSSMGSAGLPNGLRTALEKIRTYIFIGFNFEKWHTQILIRILSGKAGYRKFAGPHKLSDETSLFLSNQFKIDFWDINQGDFLGTFANEALKFVDPDPNNAQRPWIRNLLENPKTAEETAIIRDIQNAQYAKALSSLDAYAKKAAPDKSDMAVQLNGQFSYLQQNQAKIDSRDYLTTLNKIADAILSLAHEIAQNK
jgi:hypothetical protein